jgi:hypothetical protein
MVRSSDGKDEAAPGDVTPAGEERPITEACHDRRSTIVLSA